MKNRYRLMTFVLVLSTNSLTVIEEKELKPISITIDKPVFEVSLAPSEELVGVEVEVCAYSTKKPYMDYRMITDTSSTQYKYIQANLKSIESGLLIFEDDYIGVALGSVYGDIGTKYTVTTDTGNTFKIVKIDEKSDNHTINGCQDLSGAIVEMVIDIDQASIYYNDAIIMGDFNYTEKFNGTIIKIEKEEI